mmetsp:Transcript_70078/g.138786  ORF Transcript_70078/g.138786 Transcript_70078/m.138786 type:complete len:83 (-) Transcript_70078:47-295(-)
MLRSIRSSRVFRTLPMVLAASGKISVCEGYPMMPGELRSKMRVREEDGQSTRIDVHRSRTLWPDCRFLREGNRGEVRRNQAA